MNKIKMIAAMFIAGILLTFVSCGDNGKSKKISIAYANWSEGIAMTNLAKAIFEDQGYDVKLLNVFVDQSSTGSSSCSQKDRCDDLIFRFHNMNLLKRESVDPFPLL